jgi:DNA-binding NtrC family response regulator
MSKSALQLCFNYQWPGNVRELENVLERSIILSQGDFIIPESFPDELRKGSAQDQEPEGLTLSAALAEAEKRILFKNLKQHNWNRQITAQVLGISRTTLFNKMRQYHIDDPRKINENLLQY